MDEYRFLNQSQDASIEMFYSSSLNDFGHENHAQQSYLRGKSITRDLSPLDLPRPLREQRWTTYLNNRTPLPGYARYHAGDIWGCLGRWYSGGWYDQGAVKDIQKVKTALAQKAWLEAGFA
jgi:hypothetical protein